jgi:hypothetical protein
MTTITPAAEKLAPTDDQRAIGPIVDQLHSHAVDGRGPTGEVGASWHVLLVAVGYDVAGLSAETEFAALTPTLPPHADPDVLRGEA